VSEEFQGGERIRLFGKIHPDGSEREGGKAGGVKNGGGRKELFRARALQKVFFEIRTTDFQGEVKSGNFSRRRARKINSADSWNESN